MSLNRDPSPINLSLFIDVFESRMKSNNTKLENGGKEKAKNVQCKQSCTALSTSSTIYL